MFALSPFAFPSISVPTGGGAVSPIMPWELVNVTTGFTKTTPDAMSVSGESHDSGTGVTTYTMGELATGNEKYNFTGGNSAWPRYSAALNDSEGTRLTTDDSFIMFVRLSLFQTTFPASADLRVAVGLCIDPTATTVAAFDGYGIGLRTRSASRVGGHFKADTLSGGFSSYSSTATDTVFGSIQRSTRRLGVVVAFGEDSDGATVSPSTGRTTPGTSSATFAASSNYSLFLGISTNSNSGTISSGETLAFRADYAIQRLR